jgi:hypothetical protein
VTEIAWLALLPCALVVVAAIAFLGPPVGHALFTHTSDRLWPPDWWEATGRPEPTKQGRFLIAALAPLLLASAILVGAKRRLALSPRTVRGLSLMSYALVLALIAIALLEQHPMYTAPEELLQDLPPAIFGLGRVLAAAILVAVSMVLLRRSALAARVAEVGRETLARRWTTLAIATGFVAICVLKAVTTDRLGLGEVSLNLPWTLNDAIAVLDGRTPLVDYHPIYAKLLPYLVAPVLSAFGTTVLAYSTFMALLDGLALMAVYVIFRRVTRSSLFACALFLPFVATSDISVPISVGTDAGMDTSSFMLASLWPMRYGGAYLLAWLTARHVDRRQPRRPWVLFLIGGLIAIDGLDFGLAAIGASAAALLCTRPPSSTRGVLRFVANVAGGVLGAIAVVTLITLARSGELPDFALLLEWPRIFTTLGWFSIPLRTWDLHLAVYATFVAAVAVAAVRLARRESDVLLTGMLAWSGVFGLLIGGYFVGRPDVIKLTGILSAWSFALSMLTIVCIRALATQRWRPTVPQLLVLFGFALSLSSLLLLSPPQKQFARLTHWRPETVYLSTAKQFIGERTRPGEKVVVLVPMSYAITHGLGLRNVAPYGFMNAIVTESQMSRLVNTLLRERVRTIFVPSPGSGLLSEGDSAPAQLQVLEAIGFPRGSTQAGILELRKS